MLCSFLQIFDAVSSEPSVNGAENSDASEGAEVDGDHDSCSDRRCLERKWTVESQKRELSYMNKIMKYANERISDLEMIVSLLKQNNGGNKIGQEDPRVLQVHKLPPLKGVENPELHNVNKISGNISDKTRSKKSNTDTEIANTDKREEYKQTRKPANANNAVVNISKNRSSNIVHGRKEISESCGIKAVPRLGYVHVYRLDPNTKADTIDNYLKDIAAGCKCEALVSKHPDIYASFKITVPFDGVEKVMDSSVWPIGTRINRFFHRQKHPQPGT